VSLINRVLSDLEARRGSERPGVPPSDPLAGLAAARDLPCPPAMPVRARLLPVLLLGALVALTLGGRGPLEALSSPRDRAASDVAPAGLAPSATAPPAGLGRSPASAPGEHGAVSEPATAFASAGQAEAPARRRPALEPFPLSQVPRARQAARADASKPTRVSEAPAVSATVPEPDARDRPIEQAAWLPATALEPPDVEPWSDSSPGEGPGAKGGLETGAGPVVRIEPASARAPAQAEGAAAKLRAGVRLYRSGRPKLGEVRLREALVLDPSLSEARAFLAARLVEAKRAGEALALLEAGLEDDPGDALAARLYARLLVEAGEVPRALAVLEAAAPDIDADPEYHAFIAALLGRLERHGQAAERYRSVLARRPHESVWWMGLAIALEGAGRLQEAAAAYRRARAGRLGPRLRRFVDERLAGLSRRFDS